MSFKTLLFCVQTLLVQSIFTQCIEYNSLPYDSLAYGPIVGAPCAAPIATPCGPWGDLPFAPTNGGSFAVSSNSPLAPSGITVLSENVIEGPLTVGGVLPFLGTVALEAVLPTAGAGTVAYGCGNGGVAITAEDYGYPAGPYGPGFAGPGYPGYGPGYGFAPACGAIY